MVRSSFSSLLTLLLLVPLFSSIPRLAAQNVLQRSSPISVEDSSSLLTSPDGTFSCGFYNLSSTAFTFSIWFSNSADKTIVWSANRDRPVFSRGSRVVLKKDGSMVLTDYNGVVVWNTNTSGTKADKAKLLDTGNLVLNDQEGNILWQSFDSPTDTLLPNQTITARTSLVSANRSVSSGYYMLFFDENALLSLKHIGPEVSTIYWPDPDLTSYENNRIPFNGGMSGALDEDGQFVASDNFRFEASDFGSGPWRRLTLCPDGNLRLYSLNNSNGNWSVSWVALPLPCDIHGLCGKNGICTLSPKPICTCPPGHVMIDESDWSQGCVPTFKISSNNRKRLWFSQLRGSDYWGYDIRHNNSVSLDKCEAACITDGNCVAIEYKGGAGDCYTKSLLLNGMFNPGFPGDIYLKLPKTIKASEVWTPQPHHLVCNATPREITLNFADMGTSSGEKTIFLFLYIFISVFFVIEAFFLVFGWWFMFRMECKPAEVAEGYKVISSHFRRYTYKELERATRRFRDEIGRGGSGIVYKGILDDDRIVAVKKLEDVHQGNEEFQAELSIIGSIYHMNLVRVWGFCSERSHRILVSEYIENGSLDKILFDCDGMDLVLGWMQRYKIALGVARGLAYLHHECLEWVIHCDVKPENILLDRDFEPKIADFGLAKLLQRDVSDAGLSQIRGTRGYIAPEWASNLPITGKVDVYSYGVVLLELVKGQRVSDWVIDGEQKVDMELRRLVKILREKLNSEDKSWIAEFVDSKLDGHFDCLQVANMLRLAVCCMEEERSKRPNMDTVVRMLLLFDDEASSMQLI